MPSESKPSDRLRDEIAMLGNLLGETIRQVAGDDALYIVEDLRRLAWDNRSGQSSAADRLSGSIASLKPTQLRVVIRAFSIFLDLLNLSEDRQRLRVLRKREEAISPNAQGRIDRQRDVAFETRGQNAGRDSNAVG